MDGLGLVHKLMGWVGLGEEKWTHVHLCVGCRRQTRATRCDTSVVLYIKVYAQCSVSV